MDLGTSLEKILQSDHAFGELFYDVFFERNPDAKQYFQSTDMKVQALMLTVSLKLIGDYRRRGFAAIDQYIRVLGTRHADRTVPREMYPKWRDSLLVALEQFHDGDWNPSLAGEWRDAIDAISTVMFKGYDKRSGV
jgi:hemoglobin-like flavoprotein